MRWDIINALISKYSYKRYLEIGLWQGDNFKRIKSMCKTSVDPHRPNATFQLSSDVFFAQNKQTFDLIFIDGDHSFSQVERDLQNSLACLAEGGTIVMHDCNPPTQEHESLSLCGGVWKVWALYRMRRSDLFMFVFDIDYGCGVIQRGSQVLFPFSVNRDYSFLSENRQALLNLIPYLEADASAFTL